MPLTIISVVKSLALREESLARSEAALMGETMRAASGELRLIQQARGAATALSEVIWPISRDTEACSALLRRIRSDDDIRYSLVAFVAEDGSSICNSEAKRFDFSNDPLFLRDSRQRKTSFTVKAKGLVAGTSVLVVSHPVFDEADRYRGLVSLSLTHSGLRVAEDSSTGARQPLTMITYDADGHVLTASREMDDLAIAIPRDRALSVLTGVQATSFSGASVDGQTRVFSVVPLVPGELYALGSWPPEGAGAGEGPLGRAPALFPAIMWLASLIVAWLAVERLVIRHIRKLRASMTSFAGGNRLVGDIDVTGASLELREMADAYEAMTEAVLYDEAELEDMVHQKEVLLREVHHRVKNNLQLIASIMNMQIRRTQSEEAKSLMRGLQDRVMSLATIHRELYQTAGLSDIHAPELLSTIVRQITNLGESPDRRMNIRTEFDDIRMTPDQAVPLALLVAEAFTNALKYARGAAGCTPDFEISLKRTEGTRAELRVRNTIGSASNAREGASVALAPREGLGTQLIKAFAMQLGGQIDRKCDDGQYELRLGFTLAPLDHGEERSGPLAAQ
ncbi:histidine kinase [Defluviimonas sp. WL0024]|uniref:histidine kinase n=1 Tax=Albidovulum salinarum TaxID=2984153 RepID=A0ABT2X8G3_9RHOB|nr:histidine kinase [Defluviimonas sp. WL0024]